METCPSCGQLTACRDTSLGYMCSDCYRNNMQKRQQSPEDCRHQNIKGCIVSAEVRNGKMQIVASVYCNDCSSSWTATDYDAYAHP